MAGLDNFLAKVSEEVRRQAEEKHNYLSDAQYFVFIS